MSQVINTNIMSLTAQRNLNTSQSSLATAMQRLSSGLRINSAKDDAAGLAISTRFTTQINGLSTAVRNANDGISLAQTTESALGELTNNLQAIRQLAVQSANATNSDSDRAALDAEVQQRLAEITRISQQTTFNGRHVLDGSFGSAAFQIGANVGETISVDLSQGTKASQIGGIAASSTGDISSEFTGLTLAAGDLTVDGTDVAAGTYTSASDLATAIQTAAATAGDSLTVSVVSNELSLDNAGSSAVTFTGAKASSLGLGTVAAASTGSSTPGTASSTGLAAAITGNFNAVTLESGDFTINGTDVTGTFKDVGELVDAVNDLGITDLTASDSSGSLKLANASGADITIGGTLAVTDLGLGTTVTAGGDETSSNTVASAVTADANVIELTTGDLTVGGTDITGTFTDAASLKSLIDSASVTDLTVTENSGELDFSNAGGSDVTIGGSLTALTGALPTTVAAATTATTDGAAASTGVNAAVTAGTPLSLAAGDLTINGVDMEGTYDSASDLVDAINGKGISGVSAYYDSSDKSVHLNSQDDLTVDGAKADSSGLNFSGAGAAIAASGSLDGSSVKTVADANDTISRVDAALSTVSSVRSDLGAIQNRFDSTISNLQAISENLSASRSRIQDTDFASETANMSRAQILQQAGVSMLAQANAAPQMVLKLLQ